MEYSLSPRACIHENLACSYVPKVHFHLDSNLVFINMILLNCPYLGFFFLFKGKYYNTENPPYRDYYKYNKDQWYNLKLYMSHNVVPFV